MIHYTRHHGGGQWKSGAGAPALQDLAAPRTRRVNAKRHGVRNASSALAVKPVLSTNLENFVSHPLRHLARLLPFNFQFSS
jgi:hypothetical protein